MTWAWGIDCGSKRAGFAFINTETGCFQTNAVTWRDSRAIVPIARSLAACREHVHRFSQAMVGHFPPDAIGFEKPTGQHPNPSLMMHAGVTVEAVVTGANMAPHSVSVTEWKRTACGSGAATKDFYTRWAVLLGAPADPDQAAALGVAAHIAVTALRFDVDRLERLTLRAA